MIIDADAHPILTRKALARHFPQPWRTRIEGGAPFHADTNYMNPAGSANRADAVTPEGEAVAATPENFIKYQLDPCAIDVAVLNYPGLGFGLLPDLDYGAVIASAINDTLAADWLPHHQRFRASIVVSASDPLGAAKEIRRMAKVKGFVQVLMASGARMPYGQRFYDPIYEAACEAGLPVALHPGTEGAGLAYPPSSAGYPSSYFEWHSGLVTSYIGHLLSLVTEGAFVKFPTLKFVLVEGGVSWLPPIMWRLDKNWRGLRVTTPWLKDEPSKMVFDHVFLTTQPIEEPANRAHLDQMLAMFPADRMLMFSTDYPHWDGDTPDFTGRNLPAGIRDQVMYKTAQKLYGIEA